MIEASELEKKRLIEIETKIDTLKHIHEGLMPVFYTVDRKIKKIKQDIDVLEDEKSKIVQGQIMFDAPF